MDLYVIESTTIIAIMCRTGGYRAALEVMYEAAHTAQVRVLLPEAAIDEAAYAIHPFVADPGTGTAEQRKGRQREWRRIKTLVTKWPVRINKTTEAWEQRATILQGICPGLPRVQALAVTLAQLHDGHLLHRDDRFDAVAGMIKATRLAD
ncbi:MAG: hypothetical protein NTZ05_16255 [Chloroflexi bacterium]|nr:hypothetical protein [Chloroflexota bacterium]